MARIFISYKRADKEKVLGIVDLLQSELKEACWMDIDGIESHAQFVSVIIKAIDDAEVFLFMYSKSHKAIDDYEADWTIRELNYAQERKKRIVFVNIDDTELVSWFLFMFPQKQQVRAQSDEEMYKLLRDLRMWLEVARGKRFDEVVSEKQFDINETQKHLGRLEIAQNESKKLFSVKGVSFAMLKVEKGSFYMGTVIPKSGTTQMIVSDIPNSHFVVISEDFYIGETAVTQELWKVVMQENPSRFIDNTAPVDSVSWDDCMTFIERLNHIMGKRFRLPTEAEWEFAARGGIKSQNFLYGGSNRIEDVAWYLNNSYNQTHPVKQKRANELGLYDMSGNVWEWCQDFYAEYENGIQRDPVGPLEGTHHVYKGGCWCEIVDCRVTMRRAGLPNFRSYGGLGVRLVLNV